MIKLIDYQSQKFNNFTQNGAMVLQINLHNYKALHVNQPNFSQEMTGPEYNQGKPLAQGRVIPE